MKRKLFALVFFFGFVVSLVSAAPDNWRKKYPTLVVSAITGENEADRVVRYKPLIAYLTKELGVKVEFYVVSDYAGVIEGMKAKKIQFAALGPMSYAQAYKVTGGNVEPSFTSVTLDGESGYHSVVVVKASSPYQTLDDLKGKSFAFADPNSTSGYLFPSFYLKKMGKNPETFFGKTGFSGSHENGVIAIMNGTYDAAATHWANENSGNLARMIKKNMIKAGDVRVIWTSPLIPNSPWTILKDLPEQMKDDVKKAFLEYQVKDPDGFQKLTDGQVLKYIPTTHDRYLDIIEINEQNMKK